MADDKLLGIRLLGHAGFFRVSLMSLLETMETLPDGMPARLSCISMYYLASHECELLLKAALLKRGIPERDVRKGLMGHNLVKLSGMLQDYVDISDSTLSLIAVIGPQHLEHTLRYGGPAKFSHPKWILESLDELLNLCAVGKTYVNSTGLAADAG